MAIVHVPVLLEEVLSYLVPPRPDALMVDATLGEGGHAAAFLTRYPELRYLGIDADSVIQAEAKARLALFGDRVSYRLGFFDDVLGSAAADPLLETTAPDLILFDLGISMHHYLESGRGFGFGKDEELDMRLCAEEGRSAADIVNTEREEEIARIIFEYGEERLSRHIAHAIVEERRISPISTSGRLAEIVSGAVPPAYRYGKIHPATRTFQALRIAVNDELGRAERGVRAAAAILAPGGTLAVISFHSLEDRIVKTVFRELSGRSTKEGIEPIDRKSAAFELIVKKPVEAGHEETARNAASRSAKLRVIRRKGIISKADSVSRADGASEAGDAGKASV